MDKDLILQHSRYPDNYIFPLLTSSVYDQEKVKSFYEKVLKGISLDEVHFISVAARNKYLTDEEKKLIRLGHTCMMGKTVVRQDDANIYLNKVLQLDAASNFYTDFDGNYIPKNCMVLYVNINPSSSPKAAFEFKKILAGYDAEAFQIAISKDSSRFDNLMSRYSKIYNNLMTCYQTQRSKKRWIDIDCDVEKDINVRDLFTYVKNYCKSYPKFKDVNPIGVITHGGLHILLNTNGLKDNPQLIVNSAIEYVKSKKGNYKEIILNKNEMIPLPGTLQASFKVEMIE